MSIGKPTPKDEQMIEQAIAIAQAAIDNGKAGVGAILLWQDEIVAKSHNMYEETGDMTAHAEMVVLQKAAKRLDQMTNEDKAKLTLYTTLEPCLMCLSAISFVGIKRVVYSAIATDANEEELTDIYDFVQSRERLSPSEVTAIADALGQLRHD